MTSNNKNPQQARGQRFGIVVSKFNEYITRRLLSGCLDELSKRGVKAKDITVVWVPGSFEIPVVALKFAEKKAIDAVICLGAVIRGQTYHFEMVSQAATMGVAQVGLMTKKPVIFGVLTTNTDKQAYARSDDKKEHKGRDAAVAAIEMINLLRNI